MEIAGASKGLTKVSADGFAHVMDDDDGDVVAPL
jgi:hypothetical protein